MPPLFFYFEKQFSFSFEKQFSFSFEKQFVFATMLEIMRRVKVAFCF